MGYATAKLLAKNGAGVIVAARRQAQRDRLVEEIAKSTLYLASDLSSVTTGTVPLVNGEVCINRTWIQEIKTVWFTLGGV